MTLRDSSVNTFARFTYVIFVDRDLVHRATGLNPRRRERKTQNRHYIFRQRLNQVIKWKGSHNQNLI